MADASRSLNDLRGLRTAPDLSETDAEILRQELLSQLQRCEWFTVGVMAASADAAVAALRGLETALAWEALEFDPSGEALSSIDGPVFLKANQNTGRFLVRRETGLGEGLLITGHNPVDPEAEDTWGPLPLDLFAA